MSRRKDIVLMATGIVVGMALSGQVVHAATTTLTASPSTQTFYLDGQIIQLEAYSIGSSNYVKLRDIGKAVDFGVVYDRTTNSVYINTAESYVADVAQTNGVITVLQSDTPFRPVEGDVIRLDDGITFTVTKAKPVESALPSPTCDWSQFPELTLPKVEAKRMQTGTVIITNLYETRRMQYTLYNAVPNCPELWENGALKLNSKGEPILRLQLGITDENGRQPFWPWREEQLTQVFYSAPMARFAVCAWDYYNSSGQFMYTRYVVQCR